MILCKYIIYRILLGGMVGIEENEKEKKEKVICFSLAPVT